MLTLVAVICLVVSLSTVVPKWLRSAYAVPQQTLLTASGLLCALLAAWSAASVSLSREVLLCLVVLGGFWLVRSATAAQPYRALSLGCWWICGILVTILAVADLHLTMIILSGLGCLNSVVGIIQKRYRVFNPDKTHNYPIGFCGNSNFNGNFLALTLWASVWLIGQGYLTAIGGAAVILCGLAETRCKTAIIGVLVGAFVGLTVWHPVAMLIAAGLFVPIAVLRLSNLDQARKADLLRTFKERVNYWRVGWQQIKMTPILGIGADCVGSEIPYLQRDLNRLTKGEFLKFENYECPYPTRLHSDIIQHLCDFGLLGLIGLISLIGLIIWSSWGQLDLVLVCGLVTMIACGLGFHLLYLPQSFVGGWIFLLAIGGHSQTAVPTWAWLTFAGIMGLVAINTILKRFRVSWYEAKFQRSGLLTQAEKALDIQPINSFLHATLTLEFYNRANIERAFYHARCALDSYDGEQRLWVLYVNLSSVCMLAGSLRLGKDCAYQAMTLLPYYEPAVTQYTQCIKLMETVNGQSS